MSHPKEVAYDNLISPLMTQIIKLCKDHNINFAAQFAIGPHPGVGGPLLVSTAVVPDQSDVEGEEQIRRVWQVMRPTASLLAFTIRST